MRKGLGVTLLTVAIAMMGLKAMSSAPVIEAVPNPIVGDRTGSSSANVFVYPDAITLSATDDVTSAGSIIWTFTVTDLTSPRYNLNGYEPVDLLSLTPENNPSNPGSAKRIDQETMGHDEVTSDTNPHTVTIRDIKLSPFPKQTNYADPAGGPGIVGTEVITLIASDGTTYSTQDFIAWTDDEGEDRYSGSVPGIPEKNIDYLTTSAMFTTSNWGQSGTFVATMTWSSGGSGKGLCMQVPGGTRGDIGYYGSWGSPYGWFDLTQNAVYKVRMAVSSASTQIHTVPLWTFYVENYGSEAEGWPGGNAYAMQVYELDNEGGANAAASYGRSVYYYYFTPAQVQTAQWNDATTGAFTPADDANNDPRVHFRVLDAGDNLVAENRLGTLCMSAMTVDRYDIGDVTPGSVIFNQTAFTASNGYVKQAVNDTDVTYNGYVNLAPKGGDWEIEVATLGPGDADGFNVESANIADNFPLAWEADKLWMYEASISAPTQFDVDNPPDSVSLRIDTPTYEVFGVNLTQAITLLGQKGMPKITPATYTMFFYTQSVTASTIANYASFRPLVEVTSHSNTPTQTPTGYINTNKGAVRIHSMKVTEVTF